jgi:hypothetical protein
LSIADKYYSDNTPTLVNVGNTPYPLYFTWLLASKFLLTNPNSFLKVWKFGVFSYLHLLPPYTCCLAVIILLLFIINSLFGDLSRAHINSNRSLTDAPEANHKDAPEDKKDWPEAKFHRLVYLCVLCFILIIPTMSSLPAAKYRLPVELRNEIRSHTAALKGLAYVY